MAQEQTERAPADLRWYIAITRRHKFLIIAVTALVLGATFVFTIRQTPLYTSQSKVLVQPVGVLSYSRQPVEPVMPDERGVAASEVVAGTVKEMTGYEGLAAELLGGLQVTIEPDSSFLILKYSDPDPTRAKEMADAFAQGYITHRNQESAEAADYQSQPIRDEITGLRESIPRLEKAVASLEMDDPSWAGTNALLTNAYSRLNYLQQQMIPYDGYVPDGGKQVEQAVLPASPSSPNVARNLTLALALGLVIGFGATLARERLDDRLRGSRDLDSAIGAPILATIPKVAEWKQKDATILMSTSAPRGTVAEAYRTLRTNLQFIGKDQGVKVIMITSPTANEGKTTTTANLAATLAQAGTRVVAIGCDLRKPRLQGFFATSNRRGLTSVLSGTATLAEVAQRIPGLDSLRVITGGPVPDNPAELLGSEAMAAVIEEVRRYADFVLLDLPPVLAVSDPLVVAPMSDGVLVVADAQSTARGAVSHTREQLEKVGANIIGCVLNNFDPHLVNYYPYENYYYYGSGSGYGGYYLEPDRAGQAPAIQPEPSSPR